MIKYLAISHKSRNVPREYVGLCAEFPSLSWLASTQEAALRGIRSVVKKVVADMKKNREPIPEPLATHEFSTKLSH